MTLNELIDALTYLSDNGYGDMRVKGNFQPNYPLESKQITVTGYNGRNDDGEKVDEPCVYIALGEGYAYGKEKAWSGDCDSLDEEDYTESEEE